MPTHAAPPAAPDAVLAAADAPVRPRASLARRLAPAALLLALSVGGLIAIGDRLSFATLVERRGALIAWRDADPTAAALLYLAAYTGVVALSIPGAVWLTLGAGFLFGTTLGAPIAIVAATVGAMAVFVIARSSLGGALRERAGPWVARLGEGFRRDAASWLLMMRLVPAMPFFVTNLVAAALGAPLRVFFVTTLAGVAPAAYVFASLGAGLGDVIDQGRTPDLGVILSPPVLLPLLGLAALAGLPILARRLRAGRTQ